MAQPPPPKRGRTERTELAKKYGHPIGPIHIPVTLIRNGEPKKSGLTPLDPPTVNMTMSQKVLSVGLEEYQRLRFWGSVFLLIIFSSR
jgi:hypothetical protein